MVREKFHQDLDAVQKNFTILCEKSIHALELSYTSFISRDLQLAKEIITDDIVINRLEEEINDQVILLITKQQPVAKDLRLLIVLIKAASDMERVGDYSVNIAKETIRIGNHEFVTSVELLEDMFIKTIAMLRQIVEAFIVGNITKAKEMADFDDQIDEMYGNMIRHLIRLTSVKPEYISQVTNLSFVSHYIERCADLATNIAEYLFYMEKGQRLDFNN